VEDQEASEIERWTRKVSLKDAIKHDKLLIVSAGIYRQLQTDACAEGVTADKCTGMVYIETVC
jgi:hypothetical protein